MTYLLFENLNSCPTVILTKSVSNHCHHQSASTEDDISKNDVESAWTMQGVNI